MEVKLYRLMYYRWWWQHIYCIVLIATCGQVQQFSRFTIEGKSKCYRSTLSVWKKYCHVSSGKDCSI